MTVVGAALVFGETLTAIQWLGGSIVLAAVLIVQWPGPPTPAEAPTVTVTAARR